MALALAEVHPLPVAVVTISQLSLAVGTIWAIAGVQIHEPVVGCFSRCVSREQDPKWSAGTGAVTPLGEAPVRVGEAAAAQWLPPASNLGCSVLFLSLCIWLAWEYT